MAKQGGESSVLRVSGLRIERDGVIIDHIDWEVQRGEHWVILGPNGSGKSSLLAAMCGYLMPSAGEVELLGEKYGECDWMAVKEKVGLVSSVVANQIEPLETAAEVVLSGLYGMVNFWGTPTKKDFKAVAGKLEEIDAGHLAERAWEQLSQGERQRVLIGRALATGCEILFMDEPCAGMDPVARERFLGFVERTADRVPMVLVTHHVEEVVGCFTHGLVLGPGGTVVGCGEIGKVMRGEVISRALGVPVSISKRGGRYALRVI